MTTPDKQAPCGGSAAESIAVNAGFVTALAEEYAKHGRATIERLIDNDPARFLMLVATVLFDERYVEAWNSADTLGAQ
jgi:hypothetical protein